MRMGDQAKNRIPMMKSILNQVLDNLRERGSATK